MQNSDNTLIDTDNNEEWLSFCSSCNSVLQSICSIGVASLKDGNNLVEENDNTNNEEHPDGMNEKPNKQMLMNHINEKTITKNIISYTTSNPVVLEKLDERREINKNSCDKVDSTLCNTCTVFRNNVIQINTNNNTDYEKVTDIVQNVAQQRRNCTMRSYLENNIQNNCETLKTNILSDNKKDNVVTQATSPLTDNLFVTNLMSLNKSQTNPDRLAQNILDRRKNIVKISKSVLNLSKYVDNMRKVILQGIHEKQLQNINKLSSNIDYGNKTLSNQDLPIYHYNSSGVNKSK